MISPVEAIADVFVTAIKSLPKRQRDAVLASLARDRTLASDLLDLAVFEDRRSEPSRPFRRHLARKRKS